MVSPDEIKKFSRGGNIVAYPAKFEDATGFMQARAFLAKGFKGKGVEFGGGNCHPVPLCCEISYADLFEDDKGCNGKMNLLQMNLLEGEFPSIKYFTNISDMKGIDDESLDFIVHNHVIEHARNPIKSIFMAHRKLKKGGVLLFAVPDKQVTFDIKRKTTPLKHLVSDFKSPSKLRDYSDIIDFIVNTRVVTGYKEAFYFLLGINIDIHFHTFTMESFAGILEWIKDEGLLWSNTEIFPRLDFQGANEFYVRLTK